jgi:DNA-binding CsgD family transcriptional regulator
MKTGKRSWQRGHERQVTLTHRQEQILQHLRDELTYYQIADAMDLGYETIKKELQSLYRILEVHGRQEAVARAYELELLCSEETQAIASRPQPPRTRTALIVLVAVVASLTLFVYLNSRSREPCAEFSDLRHLHWEEVTANWKTEPGSTITIIEAAPDSYFGKIESEVLTVDTSLCPVLHIHVNRLDPTAGYAIQVLDRQTEGASAVEVLSQDCPGTQTVHLPDAMNWTGGGTHTFTLNLWVTGEGKSFSFDHLALAAE